jgi:hypothetical protein
MTRGWGRYTWMKPIPSSKACPVVPMKVMALACVAMTDRPMAPQGSRRLARKKPSTPTFFRLW